VHTHNTRSKAELYVGVCSLHISRMNPAVCVCVPTLYNALPEEIRAIRGYKRYVSALKKFMYAKKYYSLDEYFNSKVLYFVKCGICTFLSSAACASPFSVAYWWNSLLYFFFHFYLSFKC
jgi:hypothetical protein